MDRVDQDRLESLDRSALLGEFCGVFAHEISQPMGTCRNYLDTARTALAQADSVPVEIKEWLEEASHQLDRASRTLGKVRELIRGPADSVHDVTLESVVASAVRSEKDRLVTAGVQVDVRIAPRDLRAFLDPGRVSLAISQLIRNSLESLAESPSAALPVVVEATATEGFVEIKVADQGIGVDAALRDRICEPFFTTKPDALGLGLSVVRSVVHNHGGDVQIADNEPQGLAVAIRLRRLT